MIALDEASIKYSIKAYQKTLNDNSFIYYEFAIGSARYRFTKEYNGRLDSYLRKGDELSPSIDNTPKGLQNLALALINTDIAYSFTIDNANDKLYHFTIHHTKDEKSTYSLTAKGKAFIICEDNLKDVVKTIKEWKKLYGDDFLDYLNV